MRIFTATAATSPGLACLSSQIFTSTDIKITTNTCFPSSNNLPTLPSKSSRNFRSFSFSITASSSVPAAGVNTQAVEKPPTADESPDHQTPPDPSPAPDPLTSQKYISEDWEMARNFLSRGLIYRAQVKGFNSGGLRVRFQHLKGFIPFSELSPSHCCKEPEKTLLEIARALCGSSLSVKVIRADEESKLLIFSEKEAVWSKLSPHINLGDIFEARVGYVADFGAFLHLRFPDGCYHLTGLLRASEVSWDIVRDVRDILNKGDEVRAKIIKIDRAKSRILLSLKQLEEDPLLETLDKVIPQNGSLGSDSSSTDDIEPIPGLETIIQELLQEDGINDITITREGFEKRVVSQDLQLWLSNAPSIGDHFTLLARAGRQVQEIQLTTTLDQEGIKVALQRVLERIP